MKLSREGYKRNSPDRNNPFNIIPSGNITMQGVDFPVFGIDELGNQKLMYPGANYQFPGNSVFEIPMKQRGGDSKQTPKYKTKVDWWNSPEMKLWKLSQTDHYTLTDKKYDYDNLWKNNLTPSQYENRQIEINYQRNQKPLLNYISQPIPIPIDTNKYRPSYNPCVPPFQFGGTAKNNGIEVYTKDAINYPDLNIASSRVPYRVEDKATRDDIIEQQFHHLIDQYKYPAIAVDVLSRNTPFYGTSRFSELPNYAPYTSYQGFDNADLDDFDFDQSISNYYLAGKNNKKDFNKGLRKLKKVIRNEDTAYRDFINAEDPDYRKQRGGQQFNYGQSNIPTDWEKKYGTLLPVADIKGQEGISSKAKKANPLEHYYTGNDYSGAPMYDTDAQQKDINETIKQWQYASQHQGHTQPAAGNITPNYDIESMFIPMPPILEGLKGLKGIGKVAEEVADPIINYSIEHNIPDAYSKVVEMYPNTLPLTSNPKIMRQAIDKGENWLEQWYKDPKTLKKIEDLSINKQNEHIRYISLKNQLRALDGDAPLSNEAVGFNKMTSRLDNGKHKSWLNNGPLLNDKGEPILGKSTPDGNYVSPDQLPKQAYYTSIHEGTHGLEKDILDKEAGIKDLMQNSFTDEGTFKLEKELFNNPLSLEQYQYFTKPTEIYSRINEIRAATNIKPGYDLTQDEVNGIIKAGKEGNMPVDHRFFKLIDDHSAFRQLMNTLPATVPLGVGLGYGLNTKKYGGPTSTKAKEILHDGTAQGYPLTEKQRRFFGWIAGGKKQEGGPVDPSNMLKLSPSEETQFKTWWMIDPNVQRWKGEMLHQYGEVPDFDDNRYDYRLAWKNKITPKYQKEHKEYRWDDLGKTTLHPNLDNKHKRGGEISHTDVKFMNGKNYFKDDLDAKEHYNKHGLKKYGETYEEFLKRMHYKGKRDRFSLK